MPKNTQYRELADAVFLKIKDLDLAELPEDIAYKIVMSYIRPACVQFQSCNGQDLFDRDDSLEEFNFRLTDTNFELLCNYMVIQWLDSQILTTNMLKARLSPADFHATSYPQQLGKLMDLRKTLKDENDQLAINKSYANSSMFNAVARRKTSANCCNPLGSRCRR